MKKIEFHNKKNLDEWAQSHPESDVRIINSRNAIRQGLFVFESINSAPEFNIENLNLYCLIFNRYLSYFNNSRIIHDERNIVSSIQSGIKNRIDSLPSSSFTDKVKINNSFGVVSNIEHSILCSFPEINKDEASALYDAVANFPYIFNAAYKEQNMEYYSRAIVSAIEYDANIIDILESNNDLFNHQIWPEPKSRINNIFNDFLSYDASRTQWNYFLYIYRKFLVGEYISDEDRYSLSVLCDSVLTEKIISSASADRLMEKFCGVIGWDWKNAKLDPIPTKLSEPLLTTGGQEGSLNIHEPRSPSSEQTDAAPARTTHTPLQSDGLAEEDWLERRPLARTLARRIKDFYVRRSDNTLPDPKTGLKSSAGLAINLTAPWGEGKSSVLKMIDSALRDEKEEASEDWLVIHFNAWDHERRRPPWWPMIEALRFQSSLQLAELDRNEAQVNLDQSWYWRAILSEGMPWLVGIGVVGFIVGWIAMYSG